MLFVSVWNRPLCNKADHEVPSVGNTRRNMRQLTWRFELTWMSLYSGDWSFERCPAVFEGSLIPPVIVHTHLHMPGRFFRDLLVQIATYLLVEGFLV